MTQKRKVEDLDPGTIHSDDDIENFSDSDSESEDESRPKPLKSKYGSEFCADFKFVDSTKEYQRDTWDDVFKYIKPKRTVNTDAKIAKVRAEEKEKVKLQKLKNNENSTTEEIPIKKEVESNDEEEDSDDDEDEEVKPTIVEDDEGLLDDSDDEIIPEDEMKPDQVVVRDAEVKRKEREKMRKKKKKGQNDNAENEEFFEDALPLESNVTFQEMNFSRPILKAIDSMGYMHPTPIQGSTIPVALLGRDVCGCAATGTGKTAAYMLPILERLLFKPKEDIVTRVLVLVPTRELGVQVYQVSKQLAQYINLDIALSVGGLDLRTQEAFLRKNPDIVIATPGRLIDHLQNTPNFSLESIEILVLDEADRMLDEYFAEQMKEIIKQCAATRQTMLFSATMSDEVQDLAAVSLKNPVKVFVNNNTDVAQNLRQEFVRLRKGKEDDREAVLAYLVYRTFHDHCMVFVQTKVQTHRLHVLLGLLGVRVGELHGNLNQIQRLDALKKFKDEEIDVLLATDVAARGLDIKGVKTVINFSMPNTYQHYVHRVGRTARAGRCGRSISISAELEYKMLKEIKKKSKAAVFERVVNQDILAKYKAKIEKAEPLIAKVLKEEKEEKELMAMENQVSSMEKKISGGPPPMKRTWFQTKEEREAAKKKEKGVEDKKLSKNKMKKKKSKLEETEEDRRISREMDYMHRQAKKAKKLKKLSAFGKTPTNVEESAAQATKRKKGNSSFDKELTRTDRRSVKKYRHGPSFQERKEAFQSKNPGKKFMPNKKKQRN
ncbi:dead-box helicase Rs1 [Oratosquilla oratoria]|uniref:dead-box helicase Rs1 n=1 Tax=Oratosquilla oratoria TaxID=337810 RepID=UPI003F765611